MLETRPVFSQPNLRDPRAFLPVGDPAKEFRRALTSHWETVAGFAPLGIEHQIRFQRWDPALPADVLREMAETVLAAQQWEYSEFSRRWIVAPHSGFRLSTHHGEWLAVAVAAYASMQGRDPFLAMRIREAVEFEVTREAKIYLELRKARDGVGLLLASNLIAHNLADLDRGVETWRIATDDPLYEFAYRAAYEDGPRAARFGGALSESSRLNRTFMAAENHRHFALRTPKALRRSTDLLMPLAPFLDDWGRNLANHPALQIADLGAIVEVLFAEWKRSKETDVLNAPQGYPRAVAGILEGCSGGLTALASVLPPTVERALRSGLFHGLLSVPKARFHEQWAAKALGFFVS